MLVKSHQEISFHMCWRICVSRGGVLEMAADVSMGRKFSTVSLIMTSNSDGPQDRRGKEQGQRGLRLADGNGVGITTVDWEGGRVP